MQKDRVDQLLKLALAVAAEEDPGNRELGVIHLLKLLYLADLSYAERHQGETYTEIPWVFYNFGPWDQTAHQEIESVLGSLALTPRRFETPRFEIKRYSLPQDHWLKGESEDISRGIPPEVYSATKRNVHTFGADTEALLHYIYKTLPMLHALPGKPIDFRYAVMPEHAVVVRQGAQAQVPLSKIKAKRKEERRLEMKREIQALVQARIQRRQTLNVPAPLDAEFMELLALLNQEDSFDSISLKGQIGFEQSIWDSNFRRECGLS